MITPTYLDALDEVLRNGLKGLSDSFVDAQVRFVTACQQPDGGFCGRQGGSDLYYTDFALRCLTLLAPGHAAFNGAESYLENHVDRPQSIVECFGILNLRRMLECRSLRNVNNLSLAIDLPALTRQLRKCLLLQGGFSRSEGDPRVSAYQTFLGVLCFQLLGEEMPAIDNVIRAVEGLKRSDGGYAELDGQTESQTSATAAAVAFLMMHGAVSLEKTADTIQFLAGMQSLDGGFKPHAAVENGDLLSTFTGLVTLGALDGLHFVDVAGIARFLQAATQPDGGFSACAGDESADVEYTYYGVGTLALLQAMQQKSL
jgi:geranylgeranyl transferase type-2 subunit beta